MPDSKHTRIRLHALDRCLSDSSRPYRIDDLVKACNQALADHLGLHQDKGLVSKRTVQKDLNFLRDEHPYNAPIITTQDPLDKRYHYYSYSDPHFSIRKRPISNSEAQLIRSALETILSFRGLPQFEWVEATTNLIKNWTFEQDEKPTAILFDQNKDLVGQDHIQSIFNAIRNQTPLRIYYQPFGRDEEVHLVSPYLLKQFNNRWFVLSQSNLHDHLINLALDRIHKIEPGKHTYLPYPEESPTDFFEDIVGVTRKAKPIEEIVLLVRSDLYPYLETKPIHQTQILKKQESDDQWKKIVLKIIPNYEFYSLILSHGYRMKILRPKNVVEDFKAILKKTYEQYF